jgi:hypothetical protein
MLPPQTFPFSSQNSRFPFLFSCNFIYGLDIDIPVYPLTWYIIVILYCVQVPNWFTRIFFPPNGSTAPWGPRPPHFLRPHDHTFRHTTVGRTSLDEGPACRRDLYLTTHNTHKRQTSMPPVGFKPTVLVSKRPQTHTLDRTATAIGTHVTVTINQISSTFCSFTTGFRKLGFPYAGENIFHLKYKSTNAIFSAVSQN